MDVIPLSEAVKSEQWYESELAAKDKRIEELENALKPFADIGHLRAETFRSDPRTKLLDLVDENERFVFQLHREDFLTAALTKVKPND